MSNATAEVRRLHFAECARDPTWRFCEICGGEDIQCFNCEGQGGWFDETGHIDWDDLDAPTEDEILFLSRSWDVPLPPEPPAYCFVEYR